ncbi:PIN domain-containing protein [Micromonospora sp. NPDC049900]|uniref:PIN domain-containing protein n=1 Tax=Micromonospora sp. NPDC049900 TaxID=3364275 RepID=UPI003789DB21
MTTAEQSPPSRFLPESAAAVRDMVKKEHYRSEAMPVTVPDERGRFAPALLPEVFPVVVDANALRDDLLRVAAGKPRTLMLNAADGGVLRLFCAPHVLDEVERHLVKWSAQRSLDPGVVRAAWQDSIAPLLRCVEVPAGLTTVAEQQRLDYLNQPPTVSRYCDPDDVPTATLAILLNAALLSKDRAPLRAVYGHPYDHVAHAQWQSELSAVGDLGPLGRFVHTLESLLGLVGSGVFHGIAAAARRVPWPWLVVGTLTTAGAVLYLVAPETRTKVQAALGTGLSSAAVTVAEVLTQRDAARRQFETLQPVQPDSDEITRHRGPSAALARACLYRLARSPHSDQSARGLTALLRHTDDVTASEAKVRATLRALDAFAEPYRGRFQIGQPARLHLG